MLEKSSLLRNQPQKIQLKLYRFFHLVLKHYSLHINIYYVLLFVQILQICNYGVHYSFGNLWNNPVSNVFRYVLRATDLSPIWLNSKIGLIIFVTICLVINCASLAVIFYNTRRRIDYDKEEGQQNMWIVKYVKYIGFYGIILQKILLLPMVLAFSAFTQATTYGLNLQLQIPLSILSMLGMISLFMIMAIFLIFYRDNSPFSKLPFASAVNYQAEIVSLIKVALGIYGSLYASAANTPMTSMIFCFLSMIALLFLSYHIHCHPGVINYPFNRITQLYPVLALWFYLSSTLQLYFTPYDKLGFFILLIGIILLPFACSIMNTLKVEEILLTNYKNIENIQQYLIYNYECIKLANNNENIMNMQMIEGIINYHISQCKKSQEICSCSKIRGQLLQFKLDLEKQDLEKERHLVFQFIEMNLEEIKEKYPKSQDIRFLLSYINHEILHNKFQSLHNLQQARQIGGGYRFQFLEYHYLRQIQDKMYNDDRIRNGKKPVDINRYYNFEIKFGKLQEVMQSSSYQHVRFWELLKSQKVSIQNIYVEGMKIIAKTQEIQRKFDEITAINSNNIHCQVLYSNFMKVIANNSQPYNRCKETIEVIKRSLAQNYKISQQFEKEKYGDNAYSGVIIISGQRTNIGIIKHCNWKVGELIGYAPHLLVGQNINVIMPKFIGNMHDDVLRNYLQLSRSEFDYVQRLVPMIDAKNFMILARVLTKPLPSLINGLQLVGIFNQVHEINSHVHQQPKYVLYRSDTGQIEALSQSCYDEFQYKINKINQFNEKSCQLSFKTLFYGVKETDIVDSKIVRGKIIANADNLIQRQQIPIDIKLRLNIYYFSVNLRLLCFYTAKKNLAQRDQSGVNLTIQTFKKSQNLVTGSYQNQWNKPQDKNERSILQMQKTSKQKFLHQISKKQQLINNQPTALKLLKGIGYTIFFIMLILAIIYTILHSQSSQLHDYVKLTQYSGQSIRDVIGIVNSARYLQLIGNGRVGRNYEQQQSNITYLVKTLQNSQFAIETIYVKYGSHSSDECIDYVLQMNGEILESKRSLDVTVFDLITSASSLANVGRLQTNFQSNIMNNLNNITLPLIDLFKIHYTGFYEVIPQKIKYDEKFQDIFLKKYSANLQNMLIQMTLVVSFLAIAMAVMLYIQKSILQLADNTILLFGHMTLAEISKEIQNCNHFLDLFYQDSYLIHLKKKQKKRGENSNQFAIEGLNQKLTNKYQENSNNQNRNIVSAMDLGNQSQVKKSQCNFIKNTMSKIQFLQKQLHLRTQAEILVGQRQNNIQNEFVETNEATQDDTNIHDKLSKNEKHNYLALFMLNIFIILTLCAYFIIQFSINKSSLHKIYENIDFIHLSHKNIYSVYGLKLFAIDYRFDTTQFKNYPLKNQTGSQYYNNIYRYQRQFDAMLRNSEVKFPFYYQGLCNASNLAKISPYGDIFAPDVFTISQCLNILKGSLNKSLRLGIVGFTQGVNAFYNVGSVFASQKYIEGSLIWYTIQLQSLVNQQIKDKLQHLITLMIIFVVIIILQWIIIWSNILRLLLERVKSSRRILQFIPMRIFTKNQKLTKQYEEYVGNLTK